MSEAKIEQPVRRSSIYAMFDMDKDLETNGIVCNYGDVKFTIARAGGQNQKFRKVFGQLIKPHRHKLDNEQMSDEATEDLMAEVYARSIVLKVVSNVGSEDKPDWQEVIVKRDGTSVPATPENIKALLLDVPELFKDLQSMAGKAANFRKAEREADEGN